MIAAAELSGQLLMVSQSRRYWRNLSAFRQQIAQLGPIGTVDCAFFKAPHFGGFREEMPFPLLIDMAIHQFDLARDLTGSEPVAVYCNSYNPSWSWFAGDAAAEVQFEFANGSRFSFSGSWCSPGLETSWNGEPGGSAATAAAPSGTVTTSRRRRTATASRSPPSVGDEPEQIAGSLAEFVAVLGTGAIPSGEAHSNVLSLAMVEAAIKSAGEGRRVLIAEMLDHAHAEAHPHRERPGHQSGPGVLEFGAGHRGSRPALPLQTSYNDVEGSDP